MSWNGIGDFLHMGGYGLYVWGSYAVTLALLAIEIAGLARHELALRRGARGAKGLER